MKKALRQFTAPDRLAYILLLLAAGAAVYFRQYILAAGIGGALLLLLIVDLIRHRRQQKALQAYMESCIYESESAKGNTLINFPLPIVIFKLEDSRIIWGNEQFFQMCGENGTKLDAAIADLVPRFSGGWLLEGKNRYPTLLEIGGRKYQVHGTLIRSDQERESASNLFMGITYWVDVTEYESIRLEYENSRPVAGIVIIDNLDELTKNATERVKNDLRDAVEDRLGRWSADFNGILRRYDRDRYLLLMERRDLERLKEGKFKITDEIHEVINPAGLAATISIGLGADAETFADTLQSATVAVELALSRGGDQTVIKNRVDFEFFGGRGSEVEKRTKVRSRVTASAFSNLLSESAAVLIMGHRHGDMDSLGAAVGVYSIARQRGLRAAIVLDVQNSNTQVLYDRVHREPEYENAFIAPADLPARLEVHTLLVDHRVAATYIQNAALNYVEPYASSACELVTEILQELPDVEHILRCEAEALLAGMVLDTKNFTLRTGERTFDAASWLRSEGADTTAVKRLFQSDFTHTVAKYRILQQAEIYRGVALAAPQDVQERIVVAQAADELLNISGVDASIVVAPNAKGGSFASARSIGDINVQVIMEKLGGGGNRSAAAAQFADISSGEAVKMVRQAIDDYLS